MATKMVVSSSSSSYRDDCVGGCGGGRERLRAGVQSSHAMFMQTCSQWRLYRGRVGANGPPHLLESRRTTNP